MVPSGDHEASLRPIYYHIPWRIAQNLDAIGARFVPELGSAVTILRVGRRSRA
jgi:hypothetical protein